MIVYHFCYILWVPRTTLVKCGRGWTRVKLPGGGIFGCHLEGWLPHPISQPDPFKELCTLALSPLCSHLFTQTVLTVFLILKSNGFFSALQCCITSSPPSLLHTFLAPEILRAPDSFYLWAPPWLRSHASLHLFVHPIGLLLLRALLGFPALNSI